MCDYCNFLLSLKAEKCESFGPLTFALTLSDYLYLYINLDSANFVVVDCLTPDLM